ncbi:hypothetical protein TWF730_010972 [Orbilia blumenaviensis]|uniref:Uncharacterized protein n=1 Tax=Orbilia blumenaviensis TaxID=1796055 RepID=A0AAV9UMT5_9PEZI
MAATTGMLLPQSANIALSEEEERAALEKLVRLRSAVRSGQHPNIKPKAPTNTGPNNSKNGQPVVLNANQNGSLPPIPPTPGNTVDVAVRPIPVFTGSSKGEQNGGRTVITVAGKDAAPHLNGGREQRDVGRQQQAQRIPQPQQQLPLGQPQWDHNQPWQMPPGQAQMPANPEGAAAFVQHLSMLAVPPHQPPPPPPFELPHGFPLLPVPHLLPGQALPGPPLPQLIPLANQTASQPEPMVVDKPPVVDTRGTEAGVREAAGSNKQQQQAHQNANNQPQKPLSAAAATDLQASLKKAQEYAATLPPKPAPGAKQATQNQAKPSQQDKARNNGGQASSPMAPNFPANTDRRDDEKQGFQGRPQRDHRQYGDKRGAEPLRKTAITNVHSAGKEERRERERERQIERERERGGDRWQGRDNRGFDFKRRRSTSPMYDESPTAKGPGFAAPPSARPEAAVPSRAHERKTVDIDDVDGAAADPKKRANPKDIQRQQQQTGDEKSPPPQQQTQPAKRDAPPLSPVVTIPRGSPTLEPLSPGKAARYGIPPSDRYAKQQPGYFRYREPYPPPPPVMGYARGPYETEYGYPPPREPRPASPRRVYLPEGRGYAQEYVYQDPYHDPYYPYPPRRPGSPPPPRAAARPQYRFEEEELQRTPRGRSPSPRATGRMPTGRPRRSSRSLSPGRERPTPRASVAPAEPVEEPRSERALIRASDAPHYADYPPYHRPMVPYDAYGDPYGRPVIIRERVPVYVTRVVYVDSNDPEGRPYRPRSPGYAPPPPPLSHPHGPPAPPHQPPPMRRYVEDPDVIMSDRVYRERDYDYGPYDRGYGREYPREYAPPPSLAPSAHHHHHHPPPPPPQQMRDGYAREYAMPPPPVREEDRERAYREREYPAGNPPMSAPRDIEEGRLPYGRDRGMPPGPPGGVRYA